MSYYRKTSGDLRVMWHDGNEWLRHEVDTEGVVGTFNSLAFSKNGTLGVAYVDATNGDVKYAQRSGSTWTTERVDDLAGTAFISLAFDNNNKPAVSYYDAWNADLKYATKSSGSWQTTAIAGKGAVGYFTNLYFNTSNQANIVYYNRKSNGVFRVKGGINNWTADTLALGGGANTNAAATLDQTAATYSWFNDAKQKIWTGDLT